MKLFLKVYMAKYIVTNIALVYRWSSGYTSDIDQEKYIFSIRQRQLGNKNHECMTMKENISVRSSMGHFSKKKMWLWPTPMYVHSVSALWVACVAESTEKKHSEKWLLKTFSFSYCLMLKPYQWTFLSVCRESKDCLNP